MPCGVRLPAAPPVVGPDVWPRTGHLARAQVRDGRRHGRRSLRAGVALPEGVRHAGQAVRPGGMRWQVSDGGVRTSPLPRGLADGGAPASRAVAVRGLGARAQTTIVGASRGSCVACPPGIAVLDRAGPRTTGRPSVVHRSARQVPGAQAVDRADAPRARGRQAVQPGRRGRRHLTGHEPLAAGVEAADGQCPGLQVEAAVTWGRGVVQSPGWGRLDHRAAPTPVGRAPMTSESGERAGARRL